MGNVLVCIKRVPDFSGEVLLAEDGQSADARFVGFTLSDHDSCAVELAVQIASATGGQATVATVGSADSVEQLRSALGVGCTAAVLVEADPVALGPADVAREIAAVVRDHEARPRTTVRTTWCCWATTPPTPATSRSASGWRTSWTDPS